MLLTTDGVAGVLEVVARHQLVLATGHLGRAEIHEVVDAAFVAGVVQVVVTHPDYPTQGVPLAEQQELAARGALLERCFAPIHTGKVPWEQTFDAIRATGVEHNVLSTDLGQVANPPVEDGLALMADRLLEAGFSEQDVRTMAVETRGRSPMARTVLVVSAHAADFVWRAAGAIATVVGNGGTAMLSRSPTASVASRASSGRRPGRPRSA